MNAGILEAPIIRTDVTILAIRISNAAPGVLRYRVDTDPEYTFAEMAIRFPDTCPARTATAVVPTFYARTTGNAVALPFNTQVVFSGTLPAQTTAPVIPALFAFAVWLAFTLPVNTLLLLTNALATGFSAAIVAALNAIAVRNAHVASVEGVQ